MKWITIVMLAIVVALTILAAVPFAVKGAEDDSSQRSVHSPSVQI